MKPYQQEALTVATEAASKFIEENETQLLSLWKIDNWSQFCSSVLKFMKDALITRGKINRYDTMIRLMVFVIISMEVLRKTKTKTPVSGVLVSSGPNGEVMNKVLVDESLPDFVKRDLIDKSSVLSSEEEDFAFDEEETD